MAETLTRDEGAVIEAYRRAKRCGFVLQVVPSPSSVKIYEMRNQTTQTVLLTRGRVVEYI